MNRTLLTLASTRETHQRHNRCSLLLSRVLVYTEYQRLIKDHSLNIHNTPRLRRYMVISHIYTDT